MCVNAMREYTKLETMQQT